MAEKIEWAEITRRGRNFAVLQIGTVAYAFRAGRKGEADSDYIPKYYRQFNGARWFSEEDIENYVNNLKSKEDKNPGFLLKRMQYYEKLLDDCRRFSDKLSNQDFRTKSKKELAEIARRFFEISAPIMNLSYHYTIINKFYPDRLTAIIAQRVQDIYKQNETLKILFALEKPSDTRREKESIIKIAEFAKKNSLDTNDNKIKEMLSRHLEKYAYLGKYFYFREPYTVKDIENRLRQLLESDLEKEVEEIEKVRTLHEKTGHIIKELRLDEKTQLMIKTVKEVAFVANAYDEAYTYTIYKLDNFFNEIANRLGVTYRQLIEMSPDEILEFLEYDKGAGVDFKNILNNRHTNHALILGGNSIIVLSGKELEQYCKEEMKHTEDLSHIKELKGQPASPGVVKGETKVILTIEELHKVLKGDVLVASATTPAYVPAMEKAAAIITDEGGLLCHAAIVARELGIPCVIGAKIATKVFKDGDLVEVNANEGIVKRIGN